MALEVASTLSREEIEERAREARRKARASWPVRKGTFEELDDDDEFVEGSGEDRVNMIWQITQDGWTLVQSQSKRKLPRRSIRVTRRRR